MRQSIEGLATVCLLIEHGNDVVAGKFLVNGLHCVQSSIRLDRKVAASIATSIARMSIGSTLLLIVRKGSGTCYVAGLNLCEHLLILAFDFLCSSFFSHLVLLCL
jgi:hypothetical protein